jgi:hypothetical protein
MSNAARTQRADSHRYRLLPTAIPRFRPRARGTLDSWGLAVLNLLVVWTVLLLVLVWVLHRYFPR